MWLILEPLFAHAEGNVSVAVVRSFRSESRISLGGIRVPQLDRDRGVQRVEVGVPGDIVSRIHYDIRSVMW